MEWHSNFGLFSLLFAASNKDSQEEATTHICHIWNAADAKLANRHLDFLHDTSSISEHDFWAAKPQLTSPVLLNDFPFNCQTRLLKRFNTSFCFFFFFFYRRLHLVNDSVLIRAVYLGVRQAWCICARFSLPAGDKCVQKTHTHTMSAGDKIIMKTKIKKKLNFPSKLKWKGLFPLQLYWLQCDGNQDSLPLYWFPTRKEMAQFYCSRLVLVRIKATTALCDITRVWFWELCKMEQNGKFCSGETLPHKQPSGEIQLKWDVALINFLTAVVYFLVMCVKVYQNKNVERIFFHKKKDQSLAKLAVWCQCGRHEYTQCQ